MVNGGDIMPPLSLCVDSDFAWFSVGIIQSKPSHAITKSNELTYMDGYDSDGDLGPFLDAIEGEKEWYEVDEDGELPAGMCDGSDYGSVASATIAKGAKESFSDDESRDYGDGCATGGGNNPDGKEHISED